MLNLWIFIILSSYSIAFSAPEQICFSSQKEHGAQRAKLPPVLQKLPVYLVTDNFFAKAIVTLEPSTDSIRFYLNVSKWMKSPIEDKVRVCVKNNQIVLRFENTKEETIEILNDKEIKARGQLTMQAADVSKFTHLSNEILKSQDKNAPSTSQPTRTQEGLNR